MTTEREVIYRIKVQTDPDALKTVRGLADATRSAERERTGTVRHETQKQVDIREAAEKKNTDNVERAARRQAVTMEREHTRATNSVRRNTAVMRSEFLKATDGVIQMGRGFALLGLVGEESTKKILDTLIKVQAVWDLARGGIQTYVALTKAVEAYRTAVLAAAAAEAIRAATAAGGGVAGGAGAGRTITNVGGSAVAGGVGARLAAGGVGGSIASSAAILPLAIAAASTVVSGFAFKDYLQGKDDTSIALASAVPKNRLARGLFANFLFGPLGGPSGILDPVFARIDDPNKQDRGLAAESLRKQTIREREIGRRGTFDQSLFGLNNQQQLRAIEEERSRAIFEDAEDSADYQLSLAQKRFTIETEIIKERRQVAADELATAERSLKLTQDKLNADRDQLKSAQERFGQLSDEEQTQLLAIGRKARAGGGLSRRERAALRGVGLDEFTRIASTGDVAEAEKRGFSAVFGVEKRREIEAGEKAEREIKVKISDARDLNVQLQLEEDRLIDSTVATVAELVEARFKAFEGKMAVRFNQELGDLKKLTQEQLRQRAGVIPR